MNKYKYNFRAKCPNDNKSIEYQLIIKTSDMIMAEKIVEICAEIDGFQELIAAELKKEFSGSIKLKGKHSGVKITTKL